VKSYGDESGYSTIIIQVYSLIFFLSFDSIYFRSVSFLFVQNYSYISCLSKSRNAASGLGSPQNGVKGSLSSLFVHSTPIKSRFRPILKDRPEERKRDERSVPG